MSYKKIKPLFLEYLEKENKKELIKKVTDGEVDTALKTVFWLMFWTISSTTISPLFIGGGGAVSIVQREYINILIYIIIPSILSIAAKILILYWQTRKIKLPKKYFLIVLIPTIGTSLVSLYLLRKEREVLREYKKFIKNLGFKKISLIFLNPMYKGPSM